MPTINELREGYSDLAEHCESMAESLAQMELTLRLLQTNITRVKQVVNETSWELHRLQKEIKHEIEEDSQDRTE